MTAKSTREVIFEITRLGEVQRVAAIDVATGTEVVVQAPAQAGLADVRALALRKLERMLAGEAGGQAEAGPPVAADPGRGKLI